MKKFLSLVLAMIMTMSLVTISAGATEYKDLTDKDEIQYEEAVAVLNRIGVITGYEDGSFRPETELTRGAAAKIIVSLMIGPDAASALPNTTSPYPDVPAGHTFAGVISYCKTAGYISGYGDGTFKPAGTLTGYAFAKMLLGALGYDSDIERFTGTGWTMNVAKIGNVAGLFDRISFDGAAAVNRDQACQLALNTLKGTLVTYGGTSIINGSTGSYTIQGTDAKPITSNNRDINANIGRKDWYGGNNQSSDYLTLEFGEEHFKDLRLEHDRFDPAHDDFGRPSNEWSYKKVTIGTFALPADFTYTTQVAHVEDNDGTKEKALGLRNYDTHADGGYSWWTGWSGNGQGTSNLIDGDTVLWMNGLRDKDFFSKKVENDNAKYLHDVADIADYTDNGTLVEVYVSSIDADFITDVVVIQTQLMEVKKVASDYVSLDQKEPDVNEGNPNGSPYVGYNQAAIDVKVEQVKDTNEDCYSVLSGLKEGDEVAVIPVTTDQGKTYEAAKVYVPETVTGTLTRVDTYGIGRTEEKKRGAVEITVGGTSYKIADWHKDMWDLTVEKIKATRKDVTLLMDEYGNALLAKDVGSTDDFMVIGNYYQALSGNKICTFVHGWDINGTELDLNLGSSVKVTRHGGSESVYGHVIGELVYYTSNGATGDADYVLGHHNGSYSKAVFDVYTNLKETNGEREPVEKGTFEIKASNLMVPLADKRVSTKDFIDGSYKVAVDNRPAIDYKDVDYHNYYYDKSVKFIYVTMDPDSDEIDSIEFKNGVQNVSHTDLVQSIMKWESQGAVKDDEVKAVVIKRESSDASLDKMLYVTKVLGWKEYDEESGEKGFKIEALMYKDGKWVEVKDVIVDKDLEIGSFATYSARESTKYPENFYHVKNFYRNNANPSVLYASQVAKVNVSEKVNSKENYSEALLRLVGDVNTIDSTGAPTGTKMIAINSGATNFNNPNSNQSYVLGNYRGVSTTIDTYTEPEGIVVSSKAYFLNMVDPLEVDDTKYYVENGIKKAWRDLDIEDTEDLIKLVLDKGYNASVTVLLNEKADSDGFRTAYLVVINDITKGSGGSGSGTSSSSGSVQFASGVSEALNGKIGPSKITVSDAGKTEAEFQVTAPDWAYTDKVAMGADVWGWLQYKIVRDDGQEFDVKKAIALVSNSYFTVVGAGSGEGLEATSAGGRVFQGKVTLTTDSVFNEDRPNQDWMKGHTAKVVVTGIAWNTAKVEYTVNGNKAVGSPEFLAVKNADGTKVAGTQLTLPAVSGGTTGKYTITGIDPNATTLALTADKYQNVAVANLALGSNKTQYVVANGGEIVKVAITSDAALPLSFAVAQTGSKSLAGTIAIGPNFISTSTESATLKFTVDGSSTSKSYTLTSGATKAEARLNVVLGGSITVPTVKGYTVKVTLPGGVQEFTLDATETSHDFYFDIDKNTTFDKSMVEVVPVEKEVKITSSSNAVPDGSDKVITIKTNIDASKIVKSNVEVLKADDNSAVNDTKYSVSGRADGTVIIRVAADQTTNGLKIAILASNQVTVNALSDADNGISLMAAVDPSELPNWDDKALVIYVTVTAAATDANGTVVATVKTWVEAKTALLAPAEGGGSDTGDKLASATITATAATGWTASAASVDGTSKKVTFTLTADAAASSEDQAKTPSCSSVSVSNSGSASVKSVELNGDKKPVITVEYTPTTEEKAQTSITITVSAAPTVTYTGGSSSGDKLASATITATAATGWTASAASVDGTSKKVTFTLTADAAASSEDQAKTPSCSSVSVSNSGSASVKSVELNGDKKPVITVEYTPTTEEKAQTSITITVSAAPTVTYTVK